LSLSSKISSFFLSLISIFSSCPEILSSTCSCLLGDFALYLLFDLRTFLFPVFQFDFLRFFHIFVKFLFHILFCLLYSIHLFFYSLFCFTLKFVKVLSELI
jgi:hypothetical protein